MNKEDKQWARDKIFQIIDTPTKDLLMEDPRDKLIQRQRHNLAKDKYKRESFSPEQQQMQLFAKYLADELKKRGFDQK